MKGPRGATKWGEKKEGGRMTQLRQRHFSTIDFEQQRKSEVARFVCFSQSGNWQMLKLLAGKGCMNCGWWLKQVVKQVVGTGGIWWDLVKEDTSTSKNIETPFNGGAWGEGDVNAQIFQKRATPTTLNEVTLQSCGRSSSPLSKWLGGSMGQGGHLQDDVNATTNLQQK